MAKSAHRRGYAHVNVVVGGCQTWYVGETEDAMIWLRRLLTAERCNDAALLLAIAATANMWNWGKQLMESCVVGVRIGSRKNRRIKGTLENCMDI